MSLEVYLLSLPLARHRQIVPRPWRKDGMCSDPGVRGPETRERVVVQPAGAPSANALQRVDGD